MNRASLITEVNNYILSGGRRTTAAGIRTLVTDTLNSIMIRDSDANTINGYMAIDADGRAVASFLAVASPAGLFLRDDGTWQAAGGGGSVNPSSTYIPINISGSFADSFLSQDTTRLFIDDGRTLTSQNGRSIIDFSSGVNVTLSSADIFANTASIVISPTLINFNAAAYNIANITPDSYLYVDATGNIVPGVTPVLAVPSLADVIAVNGAMAGVPITSPDTLSTFYLTNSLAQLDWQDGTAQGQLYFNATNIGLAWSDGTKSAAFNGNATEAELIHSDNLTVNSIVVNIGTRSDNTVINYGNSSTVHNFLGSALYEYQANQYVLDKLITLNYNGAAASGIGVGFEIEENSVITGYLKTNGSRTGFSFLAPVNAAETDFIFSSTSARTKTFQDSTSTIAEYANKLSVFAATTSAELAGVISDETGSGSLVFATSPNLVTPSLGVATAVSLALSSFINESKGSDIASAATTDIGAATGNFIHVTGTTTITALGTVQAGTRRVVLFDGALILTHNATSLILPTSANITTEAGDTAVFISEGSGNWRCISYQRKSGIPVVREFDIMCGSLAVFSPLDNAVTFVGPSTPLAPNATDTVRQFKGIDGTIFECVIYVDPTSTLGSGETVTYELWNVTDGTVVGTLGTITYDSRGNQTEFGVSLTTLSTKYYSVRITNPAYGTNPANCYTTIRMKGRKS